MFEKNNSKDKLTVIVERDGQKEIICPTCEMSIIDRFVNFITNGPCTGDLVVNSGITDLATYIKDNYTIAAYGEGGTNPAVTDTVLESEIDRKTVDTAVITTTDLVSDTAHFEVTFEIVSDVTVREFALFKTDGNTMLCRQLAGPLTLKAGDSLTFIEDIQES